MASTPPAPAGLQNPAMPSAAKSASPLHLHAAAACRGAARAHARIQDLGAGIMLLLHLSFVYICTASDAMASSISLCNLPNESGNAFNP